LRIYAESGEEFLVRHCYLKILHWFTTVLLRHCIEKVTFNSLC
jgi:hypothetical protein